MLSKHNRRSFLLTALGLAGAGAAARLAGDQATGGARAAAKETARLTTVEAAAAYRRAIAQTAAMVSNSRALALARGSGLSILNLTWEDTGRYKGSSVGPNISDLTIQVGARDPQSETLSVTCMPVFRYPNFSDRTADLDPRDFSLLVGNQDGDRLSRVSLYDFLENPTAFLSQPNAWKSPQKTLLAPARDGKVLVSAQACFLPVPKAGVATFNPVVFNYQSVPGDPAVLTVLATREGTSVTVIDNKRDAFETGAVWGQRLFHNARGQRASLTGQRESDFAAGTSSGGANSVQAPGSAAAGLNLVLLIQIPLKQKNPMRFASPVALSMNGMAPSDGIRRRSAQSNVENAVIGHGDEEGPFTEIDDLAIERDERFPVRVTVQFYKATDNGVVSENDVRAIKEQIDRVYAQSAFVGSLVTGGQTGRVTEYQGAKVQPADWWEQFWRRYEASTGVGRDLATARLRDLLGASYLQRPVSDLYLRNLLRGKLGS